MPNLVSFFTMILVEIYKITGNLGLSIIGLTIVLRSLLLPLTLPSLKAQNIMRKLKPELDKLKDKHKDKKVLQQKQLELYKKYNVNPLSGCLPQIFQLIVLVFLYRTLISFLGDTSGQGIEINTSFLWLNLSIPDSKYILPIIASLSQLVLSIMIAPGAEIRDVISNKAKSKKLQEANKKEEDGAEMAQTMQRQMMFIMPLMTGFIATRFPSGLALYWVVSTLFSVAQQFAISGAGGLTLYFNRARRIIQKK